MEDAPNQPGAAIAGEAGHEAVAVMVHGTYAANDENSGSNWWQAGSPVSRRLRDLLPGFVRPADEEEVFHWSGENSERARSKAAAKLVSHLRKLEVKGQDYHLVGHSHGGSVIWNAMKLTTLSKRPLKGLRSWTTVGTPFMHHCSPGAWNVRNLLGLIVGLLLLVPAMSAPKQLVKIVYNMAADNRTAIILERLYATAVHVGLDLDPKPDLI